MKAFQIIVSLTTGVLLTAILLSPARSGDDGEPATKIEFTRSAIDFGVVVGDIEKSVAFYKDALGFTERNGFDVPAELGRDIGLSDNHPFHIHVLTLGDGEEAAKVKLMQFKGVKSHQTDHQFIHSSLGMSYMTVWVKDLNASLKRAAEHGVKPIAKSPLALGGPLHIAVVRDPDGNFVELIGPKGS